MSNQPNQSPDYLSYLIRLRRTQTGDGNVWRACLEEPLTQEVFRFDDLQSLLTFLLAQTGQSAATDARNRP